MIGLLLLGFLIGMRHALEADHVAAVASLATRTDSLGQAVKQGAVWGLGHTVTLFLFSGVVLLSDAIIPDRYALGLEFIVGIMLTVLGIDVLRRMVSERVHFHSHRHNDDVVHFHAHSHKGQKTPHSRDQHDHEHKSPFPLRAFFVGLIHGMAGSAALIVLALHSVESTATGLVYVLLFGIGSIIGMAALSAIISIPLRRSEKGLTWLNSSVQAVFGFCTVAIGIGLMMDTGTSLVPTAWF